MKPVVVFTTNDRPEYLYRTLRSWQEVRGVEDTHIIFQAEPHQVVVDLIDGLVDYSAALEIRVNYQQLGCEANTGVALAAGFSTGADFVVAAEDDILVSHDVLEYMVWASREYAEDQSVFAVCALQQEEPLGQAVVRRVKWFFPHVWGIWRDRWEQVAGDWPQGQRDGGSWDHYLNNYMKKTGQVTLQPLTTRSQTIGEFGTYQAGSLRKLWDRQCFIPEVEPQRYWEWPGVFAPDGKRVK